MFSPVQTDVAYQPSDGVNATFGDLDVRGVLVISNAKDAAGNILGQLVNSSNEDIQVAFASEGGAGPEVTVPRRSSFNLGEVDPATLPKVTVAPGDVLTLQVTTAGTGQNVLTVPVLPARGYYADDAPAGSPALPTETPQPSESADDH